MIITIIQKKKKKVFIHSQYQEKVYFLSQNLQELLALIWSISEK